ncbi:MAG TPA: LptF/LptG family permease [Magnetospirillaceae bacterium]|nr:LptF/LptG family permease [Magnetospirillaceae bacterium]
MKIQWTLASYALSRIVPAFLVSAAFFSLLFQLVDLFANLVRYIQNDATPAQVFRIMALYLPRSLTLSIAPASLFAAAYTFGTLRTTNELIVVHGSGVSLASFSVPVLAFAALVSAGGFWFEDAIALPLFREKKDASLTLTGQAVSFSNADIALHNRTTGIVWTADHFADEDRLLSGVTAVRRDQSGNLVERVDARRARWRDGLWIFQDARRWSREADGSWMETFSGTWESQDYAEPPESFRRRRRNLDELRLLEALAYVRFLEAAGLPYRGPAAETYERFAFALSPLIVVLLSIGAGGRLRRNVFLSSLLISLASSTVYYVFRMVVLLLARLDLVAPVAGAAAPAVFFLVLGFALFRTAHT